MRRYVTTAYALDVETLGLDAGFDLDTFRAAIEGHVLAKGQDGARR